MSRDSLDNLLGHADAMFPPPRPTGHLLDRVVTRKARRQRRNLVIATIATIGLVGVVVHFALSRGSIVERHESTRSAPDASNWREQVAKLESEASLHQRAAEDLMAIQQRTQSLQQLEMRTLLASDSLSYLERARDRAARIMLMDADRMAAQPGGSRQADETYRRATQLFPETAAAREASERLRTSGV